MTSSCGTCCRDTFYDGWVSPDHVTGFPGDTTQFTAWQRNIATCSSYIYPPFNPTATWSSLAPTVASCDGGQATAINPGAATIRAEWEATDFSTCEAQPVDVIAEALCDVVSRISGPSTLWWFNGESPSNYSTQITLSTTANATSYQWEIIAGTDKVRLLNSDSSSVTVESTGISTASGDVSIRLTINGVASDTHHLTVLTPSYLVYMDEADEIDNNYGYISIISYELNDQFGDLLPYKVPINERFTSLVIPDYTGQNWHRGEASGANQFPFSIEDTISGELLSANPPPNPTPTRPCTFTVGHLCDTLVHHFSGELYVGSIISGRGVRVQANTWQRFTDHASHTNRISPVP